MVLVFQAPAYHAGELTQDCVSVIEDPSRPQPESNQILALHWGPNPSFTHISHTPNVLAFGLVPIYIWQMGEHIHKMTTSCVKCTEIAYKDKGKQQLSLCSIQNT